VERVEVDQFRLLSPFIAILYTTHGYGVHGLFAQLQGFTVRGRKIRGQRRSQRDGAT
jgi:hypothetical protein